MINAVCRRQAVVGALEQVGSTREVDRKPQQLVA